MILLRGNLSCLFWCIKCATISDCKNSTKIHTHTSHHLARWHIYRDTVSRPSRLSESYQFEEMTKIWWKYSSVGKLLHKLLISLTQPTFLPLTFRSPSETFIGRSMINSSSDFLPRRITIVPRTGRGINHTSSDEGLWQRPKRER